MISVNNGQNGPRFISVPCITVSLVKLYLSNPTLLGLTMRSDLPLGNVDLSTIDSSILNTMTDLSGTDIFTTPLLTEFAKSREISSSSWPTPEVTLRPFGPLSGSCNQEIHLLVCFLMDLPLQHLI